MNRLWLSILLFLTSPLWALILIDVRPFQLGTSGAKEIKGIRVVYVDRDHQRLQRVVYLDNSHGRLHVKLKEGLIIHGDRVALAPTFSPQQYLVRSSGPIEASSGLRPRTHQTENGPPFFIWGASLSPLAAPELMAVLNRFSKAGRGEESPFHATWISEDGKRTTLRPLGRLHPIRIINTQELGRLGEVVTDLIFFSYGLSPLPSKFEHNHGFDGLYVNRALDTLFITESKCRPSESKSVSKYMKECLSECKIREMYDKIKVKNIELPAFWKTFNGLLKKSGQGIYKAVQRIKGNGAIETLVVPFSFEEWNKCSISSLAQLSFDQKVISVQDLIDRLGLDRLHKQKLIERLRP